MIRLTWGNEKYLSQVSTSKKSKVGAESNWAHIICFADKRHSTFCCGPLSKSEGELRKTSEEKNIFEEQNIWRCNENISRFNGSWNKRAESECRVAFWKQTILGFDPGTRTSSRETSLKITSCLPTNLSHGCFGQKPNVERWIVLQPWFSNSSGSMDCENRRRHDQQYLETWSSCWSFEIPEVMTTK